ncbi:MAG: lipase family protein [Micrococcaceae bacterium]
MHFTGGTTLIDTEYLQITAHKIASYTTTLDSQQKVLQRQQILNNAFFSKPQTAHFEWELIKIEQLLTCETDSLYLTIQKLKLASQNYAIIEQENTSLLNALPTSSRVNSKFNTEVTNIDNTQTPYNYSDLTKQLHAAYRQDATINIQKIAIPGRNTKWIVYIPGLQDVTPPWLTKLLPFFSNVPFLGNLAQKFVDDDTNTHDFDSCIRGYLGLDSDHKKTIRDAIQTASIKPSEEILLVGHSLGGISAVGLLNDRQFMQEHKIAGVITMGSPIEHLTISNKIPVLAIDNDHDPVPKLDLNTKGFSSALHTLVTTEKPRNLNPLTTHRMGSYFETANKLDQQKHPSLSTMNSILAGFSVVGAKSNITSYRQRRKPKKKN